MAAEDHNVNPIIVEPAASSSQGTPPRLLTPSHHTSSSSNSSASSRPQSRGSSATLPSEISSPAIKDVGSYELNNTRPPTPPDLEPLPPNSLSLPNERPRNLTNPSPKLPSERVERSSCSNVPPGRSFCVTIFSRRRWLEHVLGVFTLVASLVGLLFIGVRTYKLAVISTENSTLDGCAALIQANFTTIENSTPLCKTAMKQGPLSSPYHLSKRTLHSSLALVSRWIKVPPERLCGFPYMGCQSQEYWSTPAIIISTTLALGGLILIMARRNARSTEVFTSPALSDIQITRHEDSGPKTATGQGIIQRQRTAPIQGTDTSSTTLVSECKEQKVSVHDRSSGEKHEGLIELQINGSTKVFYKIKTGEFIHLKHWKHHHDSSDLDSPFNSDDPLSIEKGSAHTGPGAFVLAKGKAVEGKLKKELQPGHKIRGLKRRLPHWFIDEGAA